MATGYHPGLFDGVEAYARVDACGDPLVALESAVNWRGLDLLMSGIVFDRDGNGGKGGRKPLPGLMMAKILILQACNNLSDDRAEFLINDRLSFKRFLGLELREKSPDSKTIWLWRERVLHSGLHAKIFAWFEGELTRSGFEAKDGQIVDATFVPTHKPTGKHKRQLAEETPLSEAQARQIDGDATFTKKAAVTHHGYKNHANVDAGWKLIRAAEITPNAPHDSTEFEGLLREGDTEKSEDERRVWGDSAYRSAAAEAMLVEKNLVSQVHERAYRNRPLSEAQKAANRLKSTVRVRIEHVFGHMETAMGGMLIHTLGLARATLKITFKNLAYNLQRFVFLTSRRRQEQCI